jgi:hypothetical protein
MNVWKQVVQGKVAESITTTTNRKIHGELKKPIASTYSMTNVLSYESKVDETIKYFLKRLDEVFIREPNAGKPCDIDNWVQYCKYALGGLYLSKLIIPQLLSML